MQSFSEPAFEQDDIDIPMEMTVPVGGFLNVKLDISPVLQAQAENYADDYMDVEEAVAEHDMEITQGLGGILHDVADLPVPATPPNSQNPDSFVEAFDLNNELTMELTKAVGGIIEITTPQAKMYSAPSPDRDNLTMELTNSIGGLLEEDLDDCSEPATLPLDIAPPTVATTVTLAGACPVSIEPAKTPSRRTPFKDLNRFEFERTRPTLSDVLLKSPPPLEVPTTADIDVKAATFHSVESGAVLGLKDYLGIANIRFLDNLTTANRRETLTLMKACEPLTSMFDFFRVAALASPECEIYRFGCSELSEYINDLKANIGELENELQAAIPHVLLKLRDASEAELMEIQVWHGLGALSVGSTFLSSTH